MEGLIETAKRLTALNVGNLTKPAYYADGDGLYLQISKHGSRSYLCIFTQQYKRYEMGLGSMRDVSLALPNTLPVRLEAAPRACVAPLQAWPDTVDQQLRIHRVHFVHESAVEGEVGK